MESVQQYFRSELGMHKKHVEETRKPQPYGQTERILKGFAIAI